MKTIAARLTLLGGVMVIVLGVKHFALANAMPDIWGRACFFHVERPRSSPPTRRRHRPHTPIARAARQAYEGKQAVRANDHNKEQ